MLEQMFRKRSPFFYTPNPNGRNNYQDDEREVVVVNLPPTYTLKHPLQNSWTLWHLEMDRTKPWEELQNEIASCNTVEDFWSIYNGIKPPSLIRAGSDYSFFKRGVRPMWEDEANRDGGRWVMHVYKYQRRFTLDNLWIDLLLSLIGESFTNTELICGAVVNVRKRVDRISLWTAAADEHETIEIGLKLRECLRLDPKFVLVYQMHKDSMENKGFDTKATYMV